MGADHPANRVSFARRNTAHLFKSFFRGRMARCNRTSGLGLGRSIAERLAWPLGGVITVTSRLGEGSTLACLI